LLVADDGTLRPPDELRRIFEEAGVGSGPVGAYCGSGVTAANTVLALHVAGFTDATLYVGSWSNWVADTDRPVATGAGQDVA
jgi:thiosulfate/3-mercaptopyruvate sulfurtransferase